MKKITDEQRAKAKALTQRPDIAEKMIAFGKARERMRRQTDLVKSIMMDAHRAALTGTMDTFK